MAGATIEVSGSGAEEAAADLRAALSGSGGGVVSAGPVEVERSPEMVVALIALAFESVSVAKTIWDWWRERHTPETRVRILLEDGAVLDLSGADERRLTVEFERRIGSAG